MPRKPIALCALAASLALCGTAHATTMSLDLDPSLTGPYNQIDAHTYFIPRSSVSSLRGTTLDNAGQPGNSCIHTLDKPLADAVGFTPEGGIWCPPDPGTGAGSWSWSVHPTENSQYKAVTEPDDDNAAAESNVVTLLTGPELYWNVGFKGERPAMQILVTSDSDVYDGTVTVMQGSRRVTSFHVAGEGTKEGYAMIGRTARRRMLKARGAFTILVTPTNRSRFVTMTASGRAVRGRIGDGGPVL